MSVEATTFPAAPSRLETAQRWLILVIATVGVAMAVFALFSTWEAAATPLKERLYLTISLIATTAMFCIAGLIAWRAGRGIANLAIALAIAAAFFNDALAILLNRLGHDGDLLANVLIGITFTVAAGLYLRASQLFPVAITRERIAASPTLWGRWKAPRIALSKLLEPTWLWIITAILSLPNFFDVQSLAGNIPRLIIIAIGIAYFHINYRSGDADVRRRVLWFLMLAVVSVVTTLITVAVVTVLGSGGSQTLRMVIGVTLNVLNDFGQVFCVFAAVFYAGAVSPSLVIRKTMVFGLTTTLLLFVFATVEVFLHHEIVHLLEVTDTLASSLVGGVFGLGFHPVKHYFEKLLEGFLARHGKTPAHH
jgi:hypothetical protein